MKFDSPLFDRVRIKPEEDRRPRPHCPACQWPGCEIAGPHRAPKGRNHEGQYWHFCLEHVREYNSSYNYFKGMSDDAVARYQKDAITGHRPTWRMGTGGKAGPDPAGRAGPDFSAAVDPMGIFRELGGRSRWQPGTEKPEREGRMIRNVERKAFDTLGLESDRMRSLQVTPKMLESERQVVMEERRLRVDNEIGGLMDEELSTLVWKAHPYRWPVIGWMKDIANIKREDCLEYFRTFYAPNNATLYVSGDFEPKAAMKLIRTSSSSSRTRRSCHRAR